MTRDKKSSPAQGLIALTAMLPWWASVAVASYLLLHHVATQPLVANAAPGQSSGLAIQAVWRGLASAGQYAIPLLCLAAAGLSVWRRKVRRDLVTDVAQSPSSEVIEVIDGMTWREFELLVGEAFRLEGYQVQETGGGGADGGVDLVLNKPTKSGNERFFVQCKQWRAQKVGVSVVRELYGVMAARGAAGGFVVTSGRFTADAMSFANGRNVTLVDGPKLVGLIRQAKANIASTNLAPQATAAAPTAAGLPHGHGCPLCGAQMVRRKARRGTNAGDAFWGCAAYPACRGTRSMR